MNFHEFAVHNLSLRGNVGYSCYSYGKLLDENGKLLRNLCAKRRRQYEIPLPDVDVLRVSFVPFKELPQFAKFLMEFSGKLFIRYTIRFLPNFIMIHYVNSYIEFK